MNKPLRPHVWEPPVLVWTVGKVASSSVYATLKHYGFETLHIHYLSDWNLTHQINKMYAGRDLATNIATSVRFRRLRSKFLQDAVPRCDASSRSAGAQHFRVLRKP
jgi:hypothetical protein